LEKSVSVCYALTPDKLSWPVSRSTVSVVVGRELSPPYCNILNGRLTQS
jgi:hypothetical protein